MVFLGAPYFLLLFGCCGSIEIGLFLIIPLPIQSCIMCVFKLLESTFTVWVKFRSLGVALLSKCARVDLLLTGLNLIRMVLWLGILARRVGVVWLEIIKGSGSRGTWDISGLLLVWLLNFGHLRMACGLHPNSAFLKSLWSWMQKL